MTSTANGGPMVSTTLSRSLPAHGSALYRLTPQGTAPTPTDQTLTARHSGKLADVFNASTADDADVVQWDANGQANQRWRFRDAGNGHHQIVNIGSGSAWTCTAATRHR